jgi:tetratricopeptide (TPR) repeat protein
MSDKQTKTLTIADAFEEGVASQRRGDWSQAEGIYRDIIKTKPDFAEAHNNLGAALKALERPEEAVECYRRALALKPDYVDALNNLARTLRALDRHEEAAESYRELLAIMPEDVRTHVNLGRTLQTLMQFEEAAASYRKALEISPDDTEIHCDLAIALQQLERNEEAVAICRKVLAIAPDHVVARNNLGFSLQALNRHQEAIASFRRALATWPDYAEAHANYGLSLLSMGDFENGWREYEWRWQVVGTPLVQRTFAEPLWDGTSLTGSTILLHAEQGLGDIIQFCRFVPFVARAHPDAVVMFELDNRLIDLARESFGDQAQLHGYHDPAGSNLPRFDVHAPLMSLPRILGLAIDDVPADVPYLVPTAPLPERSDQRIVVGLSWFSGNRRTGARRSIPLAALAPLAAVPGVRFVSLQYGDTTEERRAAAADVDLIVEAEPGRQFLNDLDAFTSRVAACDLVISVDNTTVHMAGALGRPVWTLLPTAADWRWMLDRGDSPWYPTMQLFRQAKAGEWGEVIRRVSTALAGFMSAGE